MVSAPGSDKKSHESDQRSAGDRQRLGLLSVSFTGLLGLQFLTVLNDNTYRWLVVPIGYAVLGQQYRSLILTLGIVCFTVPYILLPAPAGYLADRFSKRTVMAGTMLLQAVILVFGVGSILITNALLVFITLGLMGAQGALLAPSKLGVIPEIVREERISAANGLMGMASVLAAVVGTVLGNELYVLTAPKGTTHWWFSGGTVIGIALLGWAVSLLVAKEPAADPERAFPKHPFGQTANDLKSLNRHKDLLGAALGSTYLWFLAAMSQVNIYLLATSTLDISQSKVGPLLAVLAAGVASGSILAGIWSGGEVNPGLTPIGAAVIVVATLMMFALIWVARGGSDLAYYWSVGFLFLMGVGGGLYDVPLRSYMQEYSPRQTRGEILAAANFLIFAGMLLASGVFWGLTAVAGLSAPELFLIGSIISAAVGAIAFWFVGDRTLETLRQLASTIGRLLGGEAS